MSMKSSNLLLKQLSPCDGVDCFLMLQHIEKEENAFTNPVNGMSFDEYKKWLEQQHNWSMGKDLPTGYVSQTIFWLYDHDIPVGIGKIRHSVTNKSRIKGGNIGYAVSLEFRGRGYGYVLLKELLQKANELEIKEKILTVEKNNIASKKIIEKNGGTLYDENESRWFFCF